MKISKLSLKNLNVSSFITSISADQELTIRGGIIMPPPNTQRCPIDWTVGVTVCFCDQESISHKDYGCDCMPG